MPNLSIKDVPDALAEALRQRASRNHRSLQGELMAIIEQAALETGAPLPTHPGAPRIVGYDKQGFPIVRQGWKTVEQIAAELKMRFPEPIDSGPSSIDIIREDRDSR
jgi:plasmid stability protein